jgi:type I restriction enzyme, S subunit
MNADRLLSHFERISDAPDAIDRLRTLVLSLAYAGKLLPGLDAPASKWHPSTVGEVAAEIVPGMACSKSHQTPKGHVHLRTHNVATNGRLNFDLVIRVDPKKLALEKSGLRRGDVIFNNTNSQELVGKTCLVDQDYEYAFSNHLTRIRLKEMVAPEFFTGYFLLLLRKGFFAALCNRWIGQAGINTTALKAIAFAFPPLAEQHRIVAKVDELMQLCDRLEASQVERESQRDRLVVAALNKLGQPTDPDEFKKDAGFQLSNLSRLSTKTEHIKELRKAILNLAVRGKLVPQDEKEGQAVGSTEHRASIELPQGWRWVRIADLLDGDSQNGYSKKPDDDPAGIPILRISAATVRSDRIIAEEEYKLIGGVSQKQRDQFQLVPGDLLACRFNGNKSFVGRMAEYRGSHGKAFIYPDKLIRLRLQPSLAIPALLRHFGESAMMRLEIESFCATTVGNWGISATNLKSVHVPLPPLAEQKRIVAKVDELMLICDQLETQIESQQKGRRQLLDALLHEALEGEG